MSALLELRDLRAGYGAVTVLEGVDITLDAGVFGVILGSNGAGKTTTLRAILNLAQVQGGTIELEGESLVGLPTAEVVGRGVAMAPEGRELFPTLSVEENLVVGGLAATKRSERADLMDGAFTYFPRLAERRRQSAGTLSGGEQQMLTIARALMSKPRLLLVDEASLGLAPLMVETVFELLARINADGVTVLAVEQNVGVIDHAEVVVVLEKGRIAFGGRVADVADRLRHEVVTAYLGQEG